MQQNLKVDIIYYDTPTDFELEFNLCGCCRMRLLTDKTNDQKLFLHMLARGVSRSRAILVFGKLFGQSGAINLVAQSIGKNLEVVDNSLYNIDSKDEINIIEGALPLVTDDGYFGGCIIESGPQTIIVLSDNKTVRKSIMTTLIHPYLEQISQIVPVKEETVPEENSEETATEDTEAEENPQEIIDEEVADETEAEEVAQDIQTEEEQPNPDNAPNSEATQEGEEAFGFVFEEDEKSEQENTNTSIPDLYLEIDEENAIYEPDKYFSDTVYNEETVKDFLLESNTEQEFLEQSHSFELNRVILTFIILLLVLIGVVCVCLFYVPYSQGETPTELLETIFRTLFSKGG